MPKAIMSKQRFINQWLRRFGAEVDGRDIEKCYAREFIWHIFSYGLVDEGAYLVGDSARAEYDAADKSDCIFCEMFGQNGVSDRMLPEYSSSCEIDSKVNELYVVAGDYSWTYVKTHEDDLCGPYFMRIK